MSKRILVVDDDPVIRVLTTEYLSAYGHTVEVLENGTECLQRLTSDLPDVLILDFQMPDMPGVEVLKRLRAQGCTEKLPVIILSAGNDTEAVTTQYGVKADAYLQKPFQMKVMLETLSRLTGQGD